MTPQGRTATARAPANIALVKYWGKRDPVLNLPAGGSLSISLATAGTTTTVTFDDRLPADTLAIDGRPASGAALARVAAFLDRVRARAGVTSPARVESANDLPTAAGLATSASSFAALAMAATRAAGLAPGLAELAALARLGSGSAPRSLLGGFVELPAGVRDDGADCVPIQVAPADAWDVRLAIAVAGSAPKAVGSTEGMERTRLTSPYYAAWIAGNAASLAAARDAVVRRDLEALGREAEASCLRMHAAAMASDPPVVYFAPVTLAAIEAVRGLRAAGVGAWFTIDAGPHVKVLCAPADEAAVVATLAAVPGVERVHADKGGPSPVLL